MPSRTVTMSVVRGLVEGVVLAGVDRERFLARAHLSPESLATPHARLPEEDALALLDLAVECAGDPLLWLHWSERQSDRAFSPVAPLIALAPTLGEGLALLSRFSALLADRSCFELRPEGEARLRIVAERLTPPGAPSNLHADAMILGGLHRVVRTYDPTARLHAVAFESAAPTERADYDAHFGIAIDFGAPDSSLVYDASILGAPSPRRDDVLREALTALAERRLVEQELDPPYSSRVRVVLAESLAPHRIVMASAARTIGVSLRELRRGLGDEGTDYDALVHHAAKTVATRLVRDPRRTIQQVAFEMGFSESSTFHRAFKRWTGTTPTECRLMGGSGPATDVDQDSARRSKTCTRPPTIAGGWVAR